jgi:hypothetical protein
MRRGFERGDAWRWISRWGFAAAVAAAVLAGLAVAVTVEMPADIPTVALRAAPVYRLEVGGALFVGLYIATMAFFLALQNRGFTEIGPGGVRAQDLSVVPEVMVAQEESMALVEEMIDEWRQLRDVREEG